jgi:hypothetical protein
MTLNETAYIVILAFVGAAVIGLIALWVFLNMRR